MRKGRPAQSLVATAFIALFASLFASAVSASTYVVKPGDTLYRLAARELGDSRRWIEVAQLNSIAEPYRLTAGQTLQLPDTQIATAQPEAPAPEPNHDRDVAHDVSTTQSIVEPNQPAQATPQRNETEQSGNVNVGADNFGRGSAYLNELVTALHQRNRSVRAADLEIEAARLRPSQASALPDPVVRGRFIRDQEQVGMVDAGGMTTFRNENMNKEALEFSQMIPLGKLGPMEEVERRMILVKTFEAVMTRATMERRLKTAFADLSLVDESRRILLRLKNLMTTLLGSAEAMYRVGQADQTDVLRAQLEISMISDRLIMLDARRRLAAAEINSLLDRPSETLIDPIARLAVYDPSESFAGVSPAVAIAQAEDAVSSARIDVARSNFIPDMELMAGIVNRPDLDPMWEVGIGFTIPIWSGSRQTPALKEAQTARQASSERIQEARVETRREFEQALAMARSARAQVMLYDNTIIPRARLAVEAAQANYRVGGVDFMTVVANVETLLGYELTRVETVSAFYRGVAMMEESSGQPTTWMFEDLRQ